MWTLGEARHNLAEPLPCDLECTRRFEAQLGGGVSATHAALAAVGVMTISMAVGQAAGTAAALAAKDHDGEVRRVAVATLRQRLVAAGACLA